jgi:predicted ATPase
MGDFLIDLMRSGRQVIVETHSEHILLRVRRELLAADGVSPDDVSVLYIGKAPRARGEVVPLQLDELGEVENWPAGFLQEATEERMALLEERARKAEASE